MTYVYLLTQCMDERIKPDDALDMGEVHATLKGAKAAAQEHANEFNDDLTEGGNPSVVVEWDDLDRGDYKCWNACACGVYYRIWKVQVRS